MQIQTGLRIAKVHIVAGQQPMSLRSDITNLQHQVLGQLALDIEVVLRRILRAQVRLELPVQQQRTETMPNRDPVRAADR